MAPVKARVKSDIGIAGRYWYIELYDPDGPENHQIVRTSAGYGNWKATLRLALQLVGQYRKFPKGL